MTAQSYRTGWFVALGLALATPAAAQRPPERRLDLAWVAILEDRDLARARFEASQADIKTLARRRLQAGQDAVDCRNAGFMAGRDTLDVLLEAQSRLALARQPLPDKASLTRPALEELWRYRWSAYAENKAKFESGRATAADFYESLYLLLDAEVQLAMAREKSR